MMHRGSPLLVNKRGRGWGGVWLLGEVMVIATIIVVVVVVVIVIGRIIMVIITIDSHQ